MPSPEQDRAHSEELIPASETQKFPWKSLSIEVKGALLLPGLIAISTLLPWVKVIFVGYSGIDTTIGKVVLLLACAAAALLYQAIKQPRRQRRFVGYATLILLAVLGIHTYIGLKFAGLFTSSDDMFSGLASRGLGFEIGIIGSAVAFALSLNLVTSNSSKIPWTESAASWTAQELVLFAAATGSLGLLAFYDVWRVPLFAGISMFGAWYFKFQKMGIRNRVASIVLTSSLLTVGGAILEGTLIRGNSRGGAAAESQGLFGSNDPSCKDVFSSGAQTDAVVDTSSCNDTDAGGINFVYSDRTTCIDGYALYINEYGWGKSGDTWHSQSEGVAPVGTCTGLSSNYCSAAFSSGVAVKEEWSTTDPQCIDSAGTITTVFTMKWSCFNSSKEYLFNDYGWGYVGGTWQMGESPDSC